MQKEYFQYGQTETDYLKAKDVKLAEAIEKIGHIQRPVIPDMFQALMYTIIGQQISVKSHVSIWQKMKTTICVEPQTIAHLPANELQKTGLSFRKVEYMQDIARRITNKELDLTALQKMSDAEVCSELGKLRGIGVWSAEMLMTFSMQRPNVLSFGDLAIQRGLRMLYHHHEITPKLFQKYRRRYSPYASVAALYLWAIAGGVIDGLKDYKPQAKLKRKRTMSNKIFYKSKIGVLEIHCTEKHLVCLHFAPSTTADAKITNTKPNRLCKEVIKQIDEYLQAKRTCFDIPLLLEGTDFQRKVWQTLLEIPYGKTASYKDIAEATGNPKAARAVGMANNKNPVAIVVPCHRVIENNGKLGGYAGGIQLKQKLLDMEKSVAI